MDASLGIYMEKNSVIAVIGGIGMLISPRALKSLNSVEKIQPRIMFNGNPGRTIITSYSPTNASDETDFNTIYN